MNPPDPKLAGFDFGMSAVGEREPSTVARVALRPAPPNRAKRRAMASNRTPPQRRQAAPSIAGQRRHRSR